MEKLELEKYLKSGLSTRQIEKITGLSHTIISYWISKYNLNDISRFAKKSVYNFNKIDDKNKAYAIGFILADSNISNKFVEISVCMKDKCIAEFISKIINGSVYYDYTYNKIKRRFPRARLCKKINDITKFTGGEKKDTRHYPIVSQELERYLLLGFFDADGCITWGRRKDRNRLWCKISIKSSLSILTGLQNMLLKRINISTVIRPVKNENCYIIEFSNKKDVLKFLDFIYPDSNFIILNRKYLNQNALRLELEENGEGHLDE